MSHNELRDRAKEKSKELYNALIKLFDVEREDPAKEKVKQDAQELAREAIKAIWGRVPHIHGLHETSDDFVEKMYPELNAAFVMVSFLVEHGVRKPPPLEHAIVVAALKKLTRIWPLRSRGVRADNTERELGQGRDAQPLERAREEEISTKADSIRINENWKSILRVDEDDGMISRFPGKVGLHLTGTTVHWHPNPSCTEPTAYQEPLARYINDLVQDGLLYTNDFRFTLKRIEDFREQGSNLTFCDRLMSAMVGEHGPPNCWRGLYFFLSLRDCLKMQYRETGLARANEETWRLSVITRVV